MKITSNLIFKTDKKYIFEDLKNIGVFDLNIDLMIFAISIGINSNTWKEPNGTDTVEVTRSTLTNYETHNALDFLFKTAILTCDVPFVSLSDEQRMKLAFDPTYEIDGFDTYKFLLGFLETGFDSIEKEIYSKVAEDVISNIHSFSQLLIERDKLTEDIINGIIDNQLN